ncbi:hypothetical protein ACFSTC_61780 [Nonomuraea ferruginea]
MSARSLYGYGIAYAVASLSCTVGPFLAVTSASLTSGGVAGGLAVFAAYALGMGLVVALLSLAVALTREAVLFRVRRTLPHVYRLSGVLLVLAQPVRDLLRLVRAAGLRRRRPGRPGRRRGDGGAGDDLGLVGDRRRGAGRGGRRGAGRHPPDQVEAGPPSGVSPGQVGGADVE